MNKETGKALTVSGKKITAEKRFTPKTASGTVKLTFTFNATAIKDGSKLVVFEKCYEYKAKTEGKLTAKHTDLNDEGQTVTIQNKPEKPDKPEEPTDVPKTGDDTRLQLMLLLMLASLFGLFAVIKIRRKE